VPDAVQVRTTLAPTTDYSQRALDDLAANGHAIDDADIERLPPPGTDQITLTVPLPDRTPRSPLVSVGTGTCDLATASQISTLAILWALRVQRGGAGVGGLLGRVEV
jgi:hypothetical protein